jgi:hypothetical protein
MDWSASLANGLWFGSNVPAWSCFRRVVVRPGEVQRRLLARMLTSNAETAFGRAHGFGSIRSYEDFARKVPRMDHADHAPWIERVRLGEPNVLTRDPVTHLVPTSGTAGGRKLIPFTRSLKRGFNAALGPWLVDLARQRPGLLGGPAYWSVTPSIGRMSAQEDPVATDSAVPIGFENDTAYLGPVAQRLAGAVMAVPSGVRRASSLEGFRHSTLLHLLRSRDLRLISVWHPSFLTLLLDALPESWNVLLADIASGRDSSGATAFLQPMPRRADELRGRVRLRPSALWPRLQVISCWADGAASAGARELRELFPGVLVQPKGLLATEACVTLPFQGQTPLAINSHFFEFIAPDGTAHLADELIEGQEYEIVVTNGGGLWRYGLGDRVAVNGWIGPTPSLRFLGRKDYVSDQRGEKLSEAFVAECLAELFSGSSTTPRFALLAPEAADSGCRYTLYIESAVDSGTLDRLEQLLRRNPHYALCRDLGQLHSPKVFPIAGDGFVLFASRMSANGARLGDIKPTALSRLSGWDKVFGKHSAPH